MKKPMNKIEFKPAVLQATHDGFNSMPSREDIAGDIAAVCPARKRTEYADVFSVNGQKLDYWKNREDTIVIRAFSLQHALDLATEAHRWGVDECDYIKVGREIFIRLWWD